MMSNAHRFHLFIQSVADRLGLYAQAYTLYSSVRPFGCSAIIGGYDKDGPALYCVEPSGVSYVRILSKK